MKRWLLGIAANLMVMAAVFDVSTATCFWVLYQPEVPKVLRK